MKARRALAYGVVWGVGATTLETLGLPLSQLSVVQMLSFQIDLLPRYTMVGMLLAGGMDLLGRRWTLTWAAILLVACAVLLSALMWLSNGPLQFPNLFFQPSFHASHLHILWSSLFYGGLFIAAYHLLTQEERTRKLLAQAAIARQDSEAMFNAAQIQALQGSSIQPFCCA